jgi:hypothetical protein
VEIPSAALERPFEELGGADRQALGAQRELWDWL